MVDESGFDRDNPEWTDADFARARLGAEVLPPEFVAAVKRGRGRPRGSTAEATKERVTLRLDRDVLEGFRAGGPGWQTRINEALRRAL
jgi:uncharacterized protein (DUF4415 family)